MVVKDCPGLKQIQDQNMSRMLSVSRSNSVFQGVHKDCICSVSASLLYNKKIAANVYLDQKLDTVNSWKVVGETIQP